MTIRALRLLTVAAAVLALVLPASGLAGPIGATIDSGVVQSVDSTQIVIRTLDGSVVSFPITPTTRVRLDRAPASLTDVALGFVATVAADRKGRAKLIQAFTPAVTERGVVTAITIIAITLRTPDGRIVTVKLDQKTRFRFLGLPVRRYAARQGALVAVTHPADAAALVVNVLKRAGA